MYHSPTNVVVLDDQAQFSTCAFCDESISRYTVEDWATTYTKWCVNADWGSPTCEGRNN